MLGGVQLENRDGGRHTFSFQQRIAQAVELIFGVHVRVPRISPVCPVSTHGFLDAPTLQRRFHPLCRRRLGMVGPHCR
jgi:hypothetical protein